MSNQNVALRGKIDTVRHALKAMAPELNKALPQHLTAERLMRVTMTAVQNTPRLLDCDRTSLFAAVMTAAQLGLEPDGILGQAYLVPFGNKVQFIPGYKGYLALARNSGEISTVQAHAVYDNDWFEYAYGIHEKLEHRPAEGDRGEIKYFYAYALYKDGGHIFEVMSRAEVDAIRDNSDGYKAFKAGRIKSNPWDSSYPQMGRKTVIRRLANYLPLNVQRAAVLDNAAESGSVGNIDHTGDVIIDGESAEIDTPPTTDASSPNDASARLDQLAGDAQSPAEVIEQAGAGGGKDNPNNVAVKPPTMTELIKGIEAATTVDHVAELLDLARSIKREDWRDKVNNAGRKRLGELLPKVDDQPAGDQQPAIPAGEDEDGGLFGDSD